MNRWQIACHIKNSILNDDQIYILAGANGVDLVVSFLIVTTVDSCTETHSGARATARYIIPMIPNVLLKTKSFFDARFLESLTWLSDTLSSVLSLSPFIVSRSGLFNTVTNASVIAPHFVHISGDF